MSDLFERMTGFVQKVAAGPVPLPKAIVIPPGQCLPSGCAGSVIAKDKVYLNLTINELFLANSRKGWTKYQPMVLVTTTCLHGDRMITLPAVVAPSLLTQHRQELPQGLLLNDINVVGPIPYRGGSLTINVLLYRVKHSDYAREMLRLIEGLSKTIGPAADMSMLTKVGATLLDGLESLFGLGDTEPVMGQRFTMSPVGPGGFRTFYAALMGPEAPPSDGFSVDYGRLRTTSGSGEMPFTAADYVLYSLSASEQRTDETMLPFYPLFLRAKRDAFQGDKDWLAARATIAEVWQQMMLSPDLTPAHAEVMFEEWKTQLLAEKKRGENTRAMSVGRAVNQGPNARAEGVLAILDL
jgi:hypothetical protein